MVREVVRAAAKVAEKGWMAMVMQPVRVRVQVRVKRWAVEAARQWAMEGARQR